MFSRGLTSSERQTVNTYLNSKYWNPLTVSITNPTNNAVFYPGNINMSASVSETNGVGISQVQFFEGSTSLGIATNGPYNLVWSNAPIGNYALTAVATDNNGHTATSPSVNMTITPGLIIVSEPASQTVTQGSNATFSVTAGGAAPFTYQWYFNSALLSGATNSTLTVNNVQVSNTGGYDVIVTNIYGSVSSSIATLSVLSPLSLSLIITQPRNGGTVP
jgi:chitinase